MAVADVALLVLVAPLEDLALGAGAWLTNEGEELLSGYQISVSISNPEDFGGFQKTCEDVAHELVVHLYIKIHGFVAASDGHIFRYDEVGLG